jgi:hypothetical protein
MTWIGDRSYSWYLWHWPMIVLAVAVWPTAPLAPLAAGVVALLPAWAAHRWVEQPLRVNPAIGAEQSARLAKLRAERDNDEVQRCLAAIRDAAAGDANLLYPMKDALKAKATVGEVCDALREVWGTYTPIDSL